MDISKSIEILKKSIIIEEDDDLAIFEETLREVSTKGSTVVKELFTVFNDETDHPEVMFNIVQHIELMYDSDPIGALRGVAEATPPAMSDARDWVRTIHCRILNADEFWGIYKDVVNDLDEDTKKVIVELLQDIKDEDVERYGNKVDEIIKRVDESDRRTLMLEPKSINTKDIFIIYLEELRKDFEENGGDWENTSITTYFESMKAWVEDSPDVNEEENVWVLLSTLLTAPKYYE